MLEDEKDYSVFLAGDNAGFERLVIRYKDGLIYYLNKIINNITIAEDLAQDAFVEVYVHKERFVPGKASFKTYLYTIGHHKAVDYVRKHQREYLTGFEYPWQALKGIKDFILQLGPTLGEEYEEVSEHVWVHKTAKVLHLAATEQ